MNGRRDDCIRWLLSQPPEKEYQVDDYRRKRSRDANAYFHVLCHKIAEKLGVSLSHVKNEVMSEYGQIDSDLPMVVFPDDIDWRENAYLHLRPTPSTRLMQDGKLWRVYLVIRGSHTYNTKEMARLIDGVVQEAKGLEIETLPPAELERMMEMWRKHEVNH